MGRTLAERVEVRRLVAWFDGKFATEVSRTCWARNDEAADGRGNPDATAMRTGYARSSITCNISAGWRRRANGSQARRSRMRILRRRRICRRWIISATWMMKLYRPKSGMRGSNRVRAFEGCLADRVPGVTPPEHYTDLDF